MRIPRRPVSPALAAARLRPMPPVALLEVADGGDAFDRFAPAPDVLAWLRTTFVDEGGPLHNPEHAHLALASIGVLWTNTPNHRQMREILGTAELVQPKGGAWQKARAELQLREWFGSLPDFLITLSAPRAAAMDDASFCALVEHELLHCAQARDAFGAPRYHRDTGAPLFALRGHDVEEFTSVVRRYGADAAGVRAFVDAAAERPLLTAGAIAGACGTCLRRVA